MINRRNVSRKPGTNIDAASDFLTVVGEAHIIEATLQFLNMPNLSSNPDELLIDHSCISWTADDKRDAVMKIAVAIVEKYCDFNFFLDSPDSSESIADDGVQVNEYACDALSLCLFFMQFEDAIAEADGGRIRQCWKYLLLFYYSSRKPNYIIEALRMLMQYHYLLPARQAQQLIWSRCVNTHGRLGKNIPMDLHMEHLNRTVKSHIDALGSNITDRAILRAGMCFSAVHDVTTTFDTCTDVTRDSGRHSECSSDRDFVKVLGELHKSGVFRNMS